MQEICQNAKCPISAEIFARRVGVVILDDWSKPSNKNPDHYLPTYRYLKRNVQILLYRVVINCWPVYGRFWGIWIFILTCLAHLNRNMQYLDAISIRGDPLFKRDIFIWNVWVVNGWKGNFDYLCLWLHIHMYVDCKKAATLKTLGMWWKR